MPANRSASRESGAESVESVVKAMRIVEHVGEHGPCSLADIATSLALPKSTLFRLLATLCNGGFLERRGGGTYATTVKLWRLGSTAIDYASRHQEIIATLRDLVARTGETAHFAVYEAGHAVYVDKADGCHPVRAYTQVAGRSPAYASATGKALLAHQSPAEIDLVANNLERHSPATIVDRARLLDELDQVRRRGIAVNRGEWRADVWGAAAPVFDQHDMVSGAVGLSGPRGRIEPALEELTALVVAAGRRLTARHGGADAIQTRQVS